MIENRKADLEMARTKKLAGPTLDVRRTKADWCEALREFGADAFQSIPVFLRYCALCYNSECDERRRILLDQEGKWLACRPEEMLKSALRGESLIAEIRTLLDKDVS